MITVKNNHAVDGLAYGLKRLNEQKQIQGKTKIFKQM